MMRRRGQQIGRSGPSSGPRLNAAIHATRPCIAALLYTAACLRVCVHARILLLGPRIAPLLSRQAC